MLNSPDLSFSQTLPSDIFNQLGELLEQMAQAVENQALVMTEAVLARIRIPEEWHKQRFTIVISEGFSVLMLGNLEEAGEQGKQKTIIPNMPVVSSERSVVELSEVVNNANYYPEQGTTSENSAQQSPSDSLLNVKLTFDWEAIASFVAKLRDLFERDTQTYQNIERYRQILAPNDAKLQSQFTLLLLEYLLPQPNQQATEPLTSTISSVSVCQPVEDALKKQLAQERLLNQVTTQIRQSLDLPIIMVTTIEQVQKFLELDRLVICKLPQPHRYYGTQDAETTLSKESFSNEPASRFVRPTEPFFDDSRVSKSAEQSYSSPNNEISNPQTFNFGEVNNQVLGFPYLSNLLLPSGCVIYESRAHESIPSVLNSKEEHCFASNSSCWEKYHQGFSLAVEDVEKTYALEECMLGFLKNMQVRAKFVAPIVFEDKLWGLLIAHQCNAPRQWTESEKSLLTSIAEQLAIAIHQTELMRLLTQEKHSLEQRVIERTMDLHDALVAAEAANRLRSEFLATISHELLTPLTYVIGMSSTLLRWSFGELNERQRDYLQTIHDSGEHLLEMINDILDLSQIEAGKAVLNITEFSLIEIAQKTVTSLLEKATTQQITLKLDLLVERQRDRFFADSRRVQQILWNLLSNGIKFTPEGGDVTLRLWLENETAVFQIEDTGIGIPEEQLTLLFEKFHQLDTPYRRRYEGTGLGLALTKQLVELHRGRIEVESTVGVGSIFTVWIPVQPASISISD